MRLRMLWAIHCGVVTILTFAHPLLHPHTKSPIERDLIGLLGDGGNPTQAVKTITPAVVNPLPPTLGLPQEHSSTASVSQNIKTTTGAPTAMAATTQTGPATGTPTQPSSPIPNSSESASSTSASTITDDDGYVGEVTSTPPAELTQWKVIGIGVITITLIAIIIISVSFFDSWWGFLRDALCGCGRRGKWLGPVDGREETMVPDWEKRSWEFRLASEDGHRYPTMASLESIVKEKERLRRLSLREEVYGVKVKSPELAYGAV